MRIRTVTALKVCFVLATALVMSSCTKQGVNLDAADFAGEYALVSVNGERVPANITHDGVALQVRWGTFTINANGTCSTKTLFVPPSGSEVAREVSATYTKEGSKLTMQWEGAGTTVGTIQGNTFTMDNEEMVFVYQK